MRLLTILGSKGGIGKSTLASNLLVAARLDGIEAVGVDLDTQGSLAAWAGKRYAGGIQPEARVVAGRLPGWRDSVDVAGNPVLAVADMPPGLPDDEHFAATEEIATASHLVIIPGLAKGPTLERIGEVGQFLRDSGAPIVFVLNMTDPRKRATKAARAYLSQHGEVCEVEIPEREHIHQAMHQGLAVSEDRRLAGYDAMLALWAFAARRLGLR